VGIAVDPQGDGEITKAPSVKPPTRAGSQPNRLYRRLGPLRYRVMARQASRRYSQSAGSLRAHNLRAFPFGRSAAPASHGAILLGSLTTTTLPVLADSRHIVVLACLRDTTRRWSLLARGRDCSQSSRAGRASEGSGELFRPAGPRAIALTAAVLAVWPERRRGWLFKRRGGQGLSRWSTASLVDCDSGRAGRIFQRRAAVGTCRCRFCQWPARRVIAFQRQLTQARRSAIHLRMSRGSNQRSAFGVPALFAMPLQALIEHTGLLLATASTFVWNDDRSRPFSSISTPARRRRR